MKRVIASIFLGLLFTGCFSLISVYSQNEALCDKFVRVHIIANSNSPYDQHMKYVVRDEIFRAYETSFAKLHSKRETIQFLQENLADIELLANQTLAANGYHTRASASVSRGAFPQKNYEAFTLPAGEYDALKIVIGSGEGMNFFCVMFPPLCVSPSMDTDVKIQDVLTENEIKDISETKPVFKFKLLEWLSRT